jgi:hypothetical protein
LISDSALGFVVVDLGCGQLFRLCYPFLANMYHNTQVVNVVPSLLPVGPGNSS